MKIVTFNQLADRYEYLTLMGQAFGWWAYHRQIDRFRRHDTRWRKPDGFCMIDRDRLVGFIGLMHLPLRTLDRGDETAGGLFALATRPEYARQGIARALFRKAHALFRDKGYRFCFLFTSRSLVAYSLYQELGYERVLPFGGRSVRAVRVYRPGKRPKARRPKPGPAAARQVYRLFEAAARDWTGFAARPPDWLRAAWRMEQLDRKDLLVDRDGYAITSLGRDTAHIIEFVARNQDSYRRLLGRVRKLGQPVIIDSQVYDPILRRLYRRLGFRFLEHSYGALMCRPFGRARIAAAFADRFHYTPVDAF